jgi:prepilin-type N-terminal cleavage/methylation domain-containing protein
MDTRNTIKKKKGFTLFEVVLAVVIIGGSGVVMTRGIADNSRMTQDREQRMIAERLIRNEVEQLRANDPLTSPESIDRYYDIYGNVTEPPIGCDHQACPEPAYTIRIRRTFQCIGGTIVIDKSQSEFPGSCTTQNPVADFRISATLDRRSGASQETTIERVITVGSTSRYSTW